MTWVSSRASWWFSDESGWFIVAERSDSLDPDAAIHPDVAVREVVGWMRDERARRQLVEIIERLGLARQRRVIDAALPDSVLQEEIEQSIRFGRLVVLREPRCIGSPGAPRVAHAEPPLHATPDPQAAKTWVEIQLLDELGQPVPYVRCRITLPNHETRECMLGPSGTARIEGIDPGECIIAFPSLDGREWSPAG